MPDGGAGLQTQSLLLDAWAMRCSRRGRGQCESSWADFGRCALEMNHDGAVEGWVEADGSLPLDSESGRCRGLAAVHAVPLNRVGPGFGGDRESVSGRGGVEDEVLPTGVG